MEEVRRGGVASLDLVACRVTLGLVDNARPQTLVSLKVVQAKLSMDDTEGSSCTSTRQDVSLDGSYWIDLVCLRLVAPRGSPFAVAIPTTPKSISPFPIRLLFLSANGIRALGNTRIKEFYYTLDCPFTSSLCYVPPPLWTRNCTL